MDLDDLLTHYFGSDDLDGLSESALALGKERLGIDFGTERDPSRRFALWSLMEGLGFAPLPADAFKKEPALKRAADDYLSAAWRLEQG